MTSTSDLPHSSSLPESIRVLQLIWKLHTALERTSLHMETTLGVSGFQRFLLRLVGLVPGITREGLAAAISVDATHVQADLEQLVAGNLLVTHNGAGGYFLTAQGASVNAVMPGTVEEAVSKASDEALPFERNSFRRMVERIVSNLGPR